MKNARLIIAAFAAAVLAFACKPDDPDPAIYVDSQIMTFELAGGTQQVNLTCNGAWTATSDSWLTVSPSSGTKSSTAVSVGITAAANTGKDRTGTVTFTHSAGKSVSVNITQLGRIPENELPDNILEVNFKNGTLNSFTTDNKVLPSALKFIWEATTNYGAKATAYLDGTDYAAEGWLISPEIDLTNRTVAYLSFSHVGRYSNNMEADFNVYITKDDGNVWTKLTIPNYPSGSDWNFIASGDIDLAEYCGNIVKIAFVYKSTAEKAGTWEIESVLISRNKTKDVDNGNTYTSVPTWMELPEVKDKSKYHVHTVLDNDKYIRNYSYLYDEDSRIATWVAYPLCDFYTEGSAGRTDSWIYDPLMDKSKQPLFTKAGTSLTDNGYDRGHQIPSHDRQRSTNYNKQTFYFINITPQNSSLNQKDWSLLESQVRYWSGANRGTDTLYVVTGTIISENSKEVTDNEGKTVKVPDSYFKAVLRYDKDGTANKGYMAAAFLMENKSYGSTVCYKDSEGNYHYKKSISLSVAELEQKTGLTFFANLASKVGAETATAIKSEKPADNAFWGLE